VRVETPYLDIRYQGDGLAVRAGSGAEADQAMKGFTTKTQRAQREKTKKGNKGTRIARPAASALACSSYYVSSLSSFFVLFVSLW